MEEYESDGLFPSQASCSKIRTSIIGEVTTMHPWLRSFLPLCSHKKTSLPITRRRNDREINRLANTYVKCLNCGEQLPYSFSESRILRDRRKQETALAG